MTNLENQYLKEDREAFDKWADSYALDSEPLNIASRRWDCRQAYLQGKADAENVYLSERNERVEEIRKLRDALKGLHDEDMDYIKLNNLGAENNHWLVTARNALVTSPTIERLLKESKNV